MNLQEHIKKILREERKLSSSIIRRLDMLDYEVEKNLYGQPFGGINICIFFKTGKSTSETYFFYYTQVIYNIM